MLRRRTHQYRHDKPKDLGMVVIDGHAHYYGRPGPNRSGFARKLRRLLGDAIRLMRREGVPARGIRLASCSPDGPAGRVDRRGLGRQGRQSADQTTEATSRRSGDSACGEVPQEPPRQPEQSPGRYPGGADERVPHAPAARPRPAEDGGRCADGLPEDRKASSTARQGRRRRLKSYLHSKIRHRP